MTSFCLALGRAVEALDLLLELRGRAALAGTAI